MLSNLTAEPALSFLWCHELENDIPEPLAEILVLAAGDALRYSLIDTHLTALAVCGLPWDQLLQNRRGLLHDHLHRTSAACGRLAAQFV